jgi:hypothetical protein
MKNKAAFLVPMWMVLFGLYAFLTAVNSGGEEVVLLRDHGLPRGLTMVLGLIGLGGGALVLVTMLSKKKSAL